MNAYDWDRFTSSYKILGNGCWEWQRYINRTRSLSGYGIFYPCGCGSKWIHAYKVSYEHFKGKVPKGLMIRHLCRNGRCVNPDHMDVGTCRDNMMDEPPELRKARSQHALKNVTGKSRL